MPRLPASSAHCNTTPRIIQPSLALLRIAPHTRPTTWVWGIPFFVLTSLFYSTIFLSCEELIMPSFVSAASLGLLTLASHVAAHPSAASAAGSAPAGHEFQAPGAGDVRSPCPGLNSLANHGESNDSFRPCAIADCRQGSYLETGRASPCLLSSPVCKRA